MNQTSLVWIRRSLLGLAVFIASASFGASAQAESRIPDNKWRHNDDAIGKGHRPHFAAEVRFGPYKPDVDSEFNTDKGPYYDAFGSKQKFYFGLEFDYMPLRIPYVGMFGPGFGWGWTHARAIANIKDTDTPSGSHTTLTIMPMHLSGVLRADELMHRTGIPIVPYAKFGPSVAVWTSGTDAGTSVRGTTAAGDPCTPSTASSKGCVRAEGLTWGVNLAVGGMFSLNWIDPRSSGLLYEDTDIAHIYLFGEWMDEMLHGLTSKRELHVGASTFVGGLAADF